MISPQARQFLEQKFAERTTEETPLAQSRIDWEEEELQAPLPAGATFAPVSAGGIASGWMFLPDSAIDRVSLLLHGGGYNAGSPNTHRKLGIEFARVTGLRVLVPDYRLAPENPFPAAVEDALIAYDWLTGEAGYTPQQIVVGGDSAGGGLTLSLLLALRERGSPMPRAAVLLSPWTDLTVSSPSYLEKGPLDPIITHAGLRRAGLWYVGSGDPADPMASSLFADLAGLPPMLIHVGGDETMRDDSRLLAERAKAAGVDVTYREWPGMWHVFHHESPEVPEAAEAMAEVGTYVRDRLGRPQ